jgi:hypothetical protein
MLLSIRRQRALDPKIDFVLAQMSLRFDRHSCLILRFKIITVSGLEMGQRSAQFVPGPVDIGFHRP